MSRDLHTVRTVSMPAARRLTLNRCHVQAVCVAVRAVTMQLNRQFTHHQACCNRHFKNEPPIAPVLIGALQFTALLCGRGAK